MNNTNKSILLFDGVCNLCIGLVQFIIKRDTDAKFNFAALQSISGQNLLSRMHLPLTGLNSVIYIKDSKPYFKSSAILHILKDLGGAWKIFFGFMVLPSFLRDFVYLLVVKTRYKIFGKRSACMVPDDDILNRFLA